MSSDLVTFQIEIQQDFHSSIRELLNPRKPCPDDFARGYRILTRRFRPYLSGKVIVPLSLAGAALGYFFPTATKTAAIGTSIAATAYATKVGFEDRKATLARLPETLTPIIEKWKTTPRFRSSDITLIQAPEEGEVKLTSEELAEVKNAFSDLIAILYEETKELSFAFTIDYFCQTLAMLKVALRAKLERANDLSPTEKEHLQAFFARMSGEILTPLLVGKILTRLPGLIEKRSGTNFLLSMKKTAMLIHELTPFTDQSECKFPFRIPLAQKSLAIGILQHEAGLEVRDSLKDHIIKVCELVRASSSLEGIFHLVKKDPSMLSDFDAGSIAELVSTAQNLLARLQTLKRFLLGKQIPTLQHVAGKVPPLSSTTNVEEKKALSAAIATSIEGSNSSFVTILLSLNEERYSRPSFIRVTQANVQIFLLDKLKEALEASQKKEFYTVFRMMAPSNQALLLKDLPQNIQNCFKYPLLWRDLGESSLNKQTVIEKINTQKLQNVT